MFRLNFSHGTHADHKARLDTIRAIEAELGRPIGVLLDLQGPSCASARSPTARFELVDGAPFRLDLDAATPGDADTRRRCRIRKSSRR